ncbi:hypothetical protein ACEV7Z_23645, partial [Vibrio parahaemolyticus]
MAIYAAFAGIEIDAVLAQFGGAGFGRFKEALAELLVERLAPIAAETRRLLAAEDHLARVLREGAEKAEAVAGPIVAKTER